LESFVAAVNNDNNSNFVNLDAGINLLTDVLCTTSLMGEGYGQQGFGGNNAELQDAELQMVLKMSEEMHRMEQAEKNKAEGAGGEEPVLQEVAQGDSKMDEEQKDAQEEANALNTGMIVDGVDQ
jgi:hypothetical protein